MALAQETSIREQEALKQTIAHIKTQDNDDGLDTLISGHAAQRHDEKRKIIIGKQTNSQKALKKCYAKLETDYSCIPPFREHIDKTLTDVLTPDEIRSLYQIITYETEDKTDDMNTLDTNIKISIFITTLIQLSYDAGYNNFELISDARHLFDFMGCRLNGTKEKLMKVKIQEDVRLHCINSSYCEIDVYGDFNRTVSGNGKESKYCMFTFRGNILPAPTFFNSEYCIIKTTNKKNLKTLVDYITNGMYNQVIYITHDGKEEVVVQQILDSETCVININKRYYEIVKDEFSEDELREAFGENKFFEDMGRKKVWKEYKVKVSDDLQMIPITEL